VTLRKCDACGAEYEARRSTSRFCSSSCRVRNHEAPRPLASTSPPAVPQTVPGLLESATRAELVEAGRLDTSLGQAAILVARRLDAAVREPGMGMAALVREHRVTLAEAVKGAQAAANPLDELRARRDNKLAG